MPDREHRRSTDPDETGDRPRRDTGNAARLVFRFHVKILGPEGGRRQRKRRADEERFREVNAPACRSLQMDTRK